MLKPPVAQVIPKSITMHGDTRVDNYFWLREKSNPEVIAYLEAENNYTAALMKPTETLQETLYQEVIARIKETDSSFPEKLGDYHYYTRTEQGKAYPIFCRKKDSMAGGELVILDQNKLAEGHKFLSLGVYELSPDHRWLAYSLDTDGSETFTLYIKDVETGELLSETIPNTAYSLEWANDNKTIFYTVHDSAKRAYKLYRHALGTDPKKDVLVYHEKDDGFAVGIYHTKDRRYLMMATHSKTSSEVHYLPADEPLAAFSLIHPREAKMLYSVEHHGRKFFILTNDHADNFKLMEVDVANPAKANWKEVIAHRDDVRIFDMDVFANHLVVYERKNALKAIRVTHLATQETYYIPFPEPVYTVTHDKNNEFNTHLLRFAYNSLTTPLSIFVYDMNTKVRELKKQYEVLGGYDPSLYQAERIFAPAPDGTRIPISLVYKKELKKDGKNPLLLYGYGSYGISIDPEFAYGRISLLDRGFIFAIAHIRGGEEMGRAWYLASKFLTKKTTFTDFIACAEHLIAAKYTSKSRLVACGRSAGGLLMGAVANLRPDLFKVMVADVPFVDALNTMLDPSIPLTILEYEEWGNPNVKEYYDYIKSYSPYDNVTAQDYPHLMVTAGLNDPRVGYWEPAKWVAKLRAVKTDHDLLLLKTNMGAGHRGYSGRYQEIKELAFEYAFILHALEVKKRLGQSKNPHKTKAPKPENRKIS